MPLWKFKFHMGGTPFLAKQLNMKFKDSVEIKRFYNEFDTSNNIDFAPSGICSNNIEIQFLQLLPHKINLIIEFESEQKPVFTDITWRNDENGQSYTFTKDEVKNINKN